MANAPITKQIIESIIQIYSGHADPRVRHLLEQSLQTLVRAAKAEKNQDAKDEEAAKAQVDALKDIQSKELF